jgi:ElaB/YqjD/DUF883 family membrane-anchored ribosome-binding protein
MAKSAADRVYELERELKNLKREIEDHLRKKGKMDSAEWKRRADALRKKLSKNTEEANRQCNIIQDEQHRNEMALNKLSTMNHTREPFWNSLK